ncbi:hypothetical protein X975_25928, partial [Stegodyphus mimosarum]
MSLLWRSWKGIVQPSIRFQQCVIRNMKSNSRFQQSQVILNP